MKKSASLVFASLCVCVRPPVALQINKTGAHISHCGLLSHQDTMLKCRVVDFKEAC